MKVSKTAKKSAKGWAGYKAAKGATKGAGKAVKRRRAAARRRRSASPRSPAPSASPPPSRSCSPRSTAARPPARPRRAASSVGTKDYDDVTLARKVESELFRPADAPKGSVSVNVNDGVVELRGELPDQAQIDELGSNAKKIDGVKDVRNLLRTGPRTPADPRRE